MHDISPSYSNLPPSGLTIINTTFEDREADEDEDKEMKAQAERPSEQTATSQASTGTTSQISQSDVVMHQAQSPKPMLNSAALLNLSSMNNSSSSSSSSSAPAVQHSGTKRPATESLENEPEAKRSRKSPKDGT